MTDWKVVTDTKFHYEFSLQFLKLTNNNKKELIDQSKNMKWTINKS